ncbi:MAG: glycosyltransferase family 9 protein [Aureliella sp.]
MDSITSFVPRNVLITRLSAIGDCLATIPLAVDVKRLWPECRITWLVDCGAAALLEPHADIDEVIRISKKWLKQPKLWQQLRSQLREKQFDLSLDPQGLTKSAMLGWLSGARVRVGFDRSQAREIAPWLSNIRVTRSARHMVDTYRELLSPWRPTTHGSGQFHMPHYAAEGERVEQALDKADLRGDWICMNVGAGWPTKLWPPSRFAEVGQTLYRLRGMRSVIVWSGESELHAAKQISHVLGPAAVLAPSTTLPELAEWLRRARLVVSSDTGPAHLAAAVGTPSVVMFGPTWGDECGPYGPQHRTVQSIVMPPRGAPKRRGIATAMNAIHAEEVIDACLDVLACTSVHRASA